MAKVSVGVLESRPEYARELEFVRDVIYKAFNNSKLKKKLKKELKKRLDRKTIGVMRVQFSDESEKIIFAISGQGVDEWTMKDGTMKDVTFSNKMFDGVEERLRERDVVWAPLTCEHRAYQRLQGEEIHGGPEERKVFAKEYRQRLENKAKSMKKAIEEEKMTKEKFKELFIKKAEYRPEITKDFIEHVIPLYWEISQCEQFRSQILESIEKLMQFKEERQLVILPLIFRNMYMKWALFEIIQNIIKAEVTPVSAEDVVEKFIKPIAPKYEKIIPWFKLMPVTICVALGYTDIPITSKHADMTVQCAEDNALKRLIEIQKSRINKGQCGRVTRIEWFSANVGSLDYKPLCPFCEVAFVPRARQLVTQEGIRDKAIYS